MHTLKRKHTGMPQEQEIPAPVTTTILFDLAIASDISESVRLVWESVLAKSSSRVTVIVAKVKLQPNCLIVCFGRVHHVNVLNNSRNVHFSFSENNGIQITSTRVRTP